MTTSLPLPQCDEGLAERIAGPLSCGQERIWSGVRLFAGASRYNIAVAHSLHGPLDVLALKRSLAMVISRHDSLRTYIKDVNGTPIQVIRPLDEFDLPCETISTSGPTAVGQVVEQRLMAEARRYIDPQRFPLYRFRLLRESEHDHVLLMVIHHIVCDRWSLGILAAEVSQFYRAYRNREANPQPPLQQYAEFSQCQQAWLASGAQQVQIEFWKQLLETGPASAAAFGRPSAPPDSEHHGERYHFYIGSEDSERLRRLCTGQCASLFAGLLALYVVALFAVTHETDPIVCVPVSGRHRAETRNVIGYVNNILPIPLKYNGDLSFTEFVAKVHGRFLEACRHQDVPFQDIQSLPAMRKSRLTRWLCAAQSTRSLTLALPEVTSHYRDLAVASTDFDFSLFFDESPEGITALLDYRTAIVPQAIPEQFAATYLRLLEELNRNLDCRLDDLAALVATQTENQQHRPPSAKSQLVSAPSTAVLTNGGPDAPVHGLEGILLQFWREEFGLPDIGIFDDFFALGGHSMLAAALMRRIEGLTGVELAPSVLLETPTIAELATLLECPTNALNDRALVAISPAGARPPLFLVHGGGGGVLSYRRVAEELGTEQPVWGLKMQSVDTPDGEFQSIETIAGRYLQEVCAFCPTGPYFLGGHSFGAVVAFEMARQLCRVGQPIGMLAIIDHAGPDARRTPVRSFQLQLLALSQLTGSQKLEYIRSGLLWRLKSGRWTPRWLKLALAQGAGQRRSAEHASNSVRALNAALAALAAYKFQETDVHVHLFRARSGSPSIRSDPWGGWGRVALRGVTVYEVPGTHMNLFQEPQVAVLAQELLSCLRRVHDDTSCTSMANSEVV